MKSVNKAKKAEITRISRKNYKLSIHDLKSIKPLTHPQRQMIESFSSGKSILGIGSAGTGKTFLGLYLALGAVLQRDLNFRNIKIVRSIVPSREIGFLPGDLEEKVSVYETPYRETFTEILGMATSYDKCKDSGMVDFVPTSFLRGQTWDNSVIVVDEVQNMNIHEINTIMTRVGTGSQVLLLGDYLQSDLTKNNKDRSGIQFLHEAIKLNDFFDIVHFTKNDIVRSDFVKAWICSLEDLEYSNKLIY